MRYAAVLFDLFDTLVRFDRERMPEIQINGKTVRSSAGMLHAIFFRPTRGGRVVLAERDPARSAARQRVAAQECPVHAGAR